MMLRIIMNMMMMMSVMIMNLLTMIGTGSARIKTESKAAKPPISCNQMGSNVLMMVIGDDDDNEDDENDGENED